eukprot:Partr_v1_DN26041_c0_g1_i1_m783 putative Histone acetyltransferase type B catalytic
MRLLVERDLFKAIPDESDGWACDSNTTVSFRLVSTADSLVVVDESESRFHPDFTYPVWGEEEKVHGFRDLKVNISLTSASMRPFIHIEHGKKLDMANVQRDVLTPLLAQYFGATTTQPASDDGQEDGDEALVEIPAEGVAWTSRSEVFQQWLRSEMDFQPMGVKVHEYSLDDDKSTVYQVFHCKFDTPHYLEYHKRIQPFVKFFIEGGSFIDDQDDLRWETFLVFQKRSSSSAGGDTECPYHLVGFSTCYSYFLYPQSVRKRISQFIILPPFQGKQHGSRLYRFLYNRFRLDSQIKDITVEDPTEGFADMRSRNDIRLLLQDRAFDSIAFPYSPQDIESVRLAYKFSSQQMTQLAEMYALYKLNPRDQQQAKRVRVWIKKRIYRKNEEVLSTEDPDVVKEKLADTFNNVREDYQRVLNGV